MVNTISYYSGLIFVYVCAIACSPTIPQPEKKPLSDASPKPSPSVDAFADDAETYARVSSDKRVAVATVQPRATQAALDVVERGGNAIDAALAAAFTLGVVDSHNSGIGGGCFILVRLASGEILAIDGREMAPQAAHRDMYIVNGQVNKALSKTGALASGIPGSVLALHQLQRKGGRLRFADTLLPAAKLAETGFAIDKTLAARLVRTAERIRPFPETAKIFLKKDGSPLLAGDRLVQADLAKTYRALAAKGPAWFYTGRFAQLTADWMRDNGGIMTADDFAKYKTVQREPIASQFMGHTIYGFPPPSSGGVHVAQILNIVGEFPLYTLSTVERYHVIAESMKLAFADRAYWLGDSDFTPVPRGLMSTEYAHTLAKKIDMSRAATVNKHHVPKDAVTNIFGKHTTHIATADKFGNWVAITTTLNTSFGSKVVIPGTGVLMNNQMDDFSAQPGTPNAFGLVGAEANSIAPGKRPLSSMSPTLVMKDGTPVMTLGAAGGPTIITQVLQTIINKIALGMSLDDAVAANRVHQQWKPDIVFVDPNFTAEQRQAFEQLGHVLRTAGSFGGTQAIALEQGEFHAVTEPRVVRRNRD